jgi:predicted alpha/beta superfamily hydrolase
MSDQFPPAFIPYTEVRPLTSSIIDQEFRILVALPEDGPKPDKLYPVLYVLDPDAVFALITQIIRLLQVGRELPELILVGVGYPVLAYKETLGLRARDYTPTEDPIWLQKLMKERALEVAYGTGGARNFLSFIQDELIPFIQSNYPVDPENRAIGGSSLSGLFALYSLFQDPNIFSKYLIGSPSLWWNDEVIFSFERSYANDHDDLPAKAFMSMGGHEDERVIALMQRMVDTLQNRNFTSLELKSHIFEDETHLSVPASAISRGLRVIYDSI